MLPFGQGVSTAAAARRHNSGAGTRTKSRFARRTLTIRSFSTLFPALQPAAFTCMRASSATPASLPQAVTRGRLLLFDNSVQGRPARVPLIRAATTASDRRDAPHGTADLEEADKAERYSGLRRATPALSP